MATIKASIPINTARSVDLMPSSNLVDITDDYEGYAYFNYAASTFQNDFVDAVSIDSVAFRVGVWRINDAAVGWQLLLDGYDYSGGGTWDDTALKQTGMQYSGGMVYEAKDTACKLDTLIYNAENIPTVSELTTNGVQLQWCVKCSPSKMSGDALTLELRCMNLIIKGTKSDGTTISKTYTKLGRDKGGAVFNEKTSWVKVGYIAYSLPKAKYFNVANLKSVKLNSLTVRFDASCTDSESVWTFKGGINIGTSGYTKDSEGVYAIPLTQIYSGCLTTDNTEISFSATDLTGDVLKDDIYVVVRVPSVGYKLPSSSHFWIDLEYEAEEKGFGVIRTKMDTLHGGVKLGSWSGSIRTKAMIPKNNVCLTSIKFKCRVRTAKPGDTWALKEVRYAMGDYYGSSVCIEVAKSTVEYLKNNDFCFEYPDVSGVSTGYEEWQSFEFEMMRGNVCAVPFYWDRLNYGLIFEGVTASECYAELEWAMPDYTVTLTAGENGTVEGAGTYHFGEPATIKATGNENYTLKQWSDGNGSAVRQVINDSVVMQDSTESASSNDITLSAEFESELPTPVHSAHKITWGGKPFRALLKITEEKPETWDNQSLDTWDGEKTRTWSSLLGG